MATGRLPLLPLLPRDRAELSALPAPIFKRIQHPFPSTVDPQKRASSDDSCLIRPRHMGRSIAPMRA